MEKPPFQAKRQEEMRHQIDVLADTLVAGLKKDVLIVLERRIEQEINEIIDTIINGFVDPSCTLTREVNKKLTNGESLDSRVIQFKRDAESSYTETLKAELTLVKNDVLFDINQKIKKEKLNWEATFSREAVKKLKAAEDAIRTDFRVGLEDSQKQCGDILNGIQEQTIHLDGNLTSKAIMMQNEAMTTVHKSERQTYELFAGKLKERERFLKEVLCSETEGLHKEISRVRKDIAPRSKCCVIV